MPPPSDTPSVRRFKPDLIESTPKTTKKPRYAPEPIETSTRSSRQPAKEPASHAHTTNTPPHNLTDAPKTRQNFEPVTLVATFRQGGQAIPSIDADRDDEDVEDDDTPMAPLLPHERLDTIKPTRRKFNVELVETAQRSRRKGDTKPALLPGDKTNVSPGDSLLPPPRRPDPSPLPPHNTPVNSFQNIYLLRPPSTPNRQQSIKPHYTSRANTRQHSYRVPSLPDIESSESDGTRSVDDGVHDSDTSDEVSYRNPTRMRESVDERVSGYLLALAARAAEKQLREQEAAAFVNTDYYEPVAHYVTRSDSEESVIQPRTTRNGKVVRDRTRRDSADEKWALEEMRKHGEKVQQQQPARKRTAAFNVEFDFQPLNADIWNSAGGQFNPAPPPKNLIGGHQKDSAMKQMRKAASPPMLGGDLDFPRCPSPEHARFDVTQGADFLRRNMCYLSDNPSERSGLWGGGTASGVKSPASQKSPPGTPSIGCWGGPKLVEARQPKPNQSSGGLWGGCCTSSDKNNTPREPTGLITPISTPQVEREDPFASALFKTTSFSTNKTSYTNLTALANNGPVPRRPSSPPGGMATNSSSQNLMAVRGQLPPSPPPSVGSAFAPSSDLDARLAREARVATEFSDAFVTQVYNYLSLGYPSLARKFDDELARIARVPVDELREDDKLAEARGYVRLGGDEVEDGVEEGMCKRWRALRGYVREWGRQMMRREMEGKEEWGDPNRAWGLPGRKGSWGL